MNKPLFSRSAATPVLSPRGAAGQPGDETRARPVMLTEAEERRLARAWREKGDVAARNRLVSAFEPLVGAMVRRFTRGRPQDEADMIQHGYLALIRAADSFDPERGVRFSTYAAWWVRAELQDYRLNNFSLVRRGRSAKARKAFFRLGSVEAATPARPGEREEDREARIARTLGVRPDELDAMRRQFAAADSSLHRPASEEENGAQVLDLLPDPDCNVEAEVARRHDLGVVREALVRHLAKLPPRERDIVMANVMRDPPATLQQLSEVHGISRERVRQLRERGLERLRASIRREKDSEVLAPG